VKNKTHPGRIYPLAIKVMAELGIDISERAGYDAKEYRGKKRQAFP
jgi:hypothetical protein